MTTIPADTPLGDLVTANPGAARVLDRFGLDYCCHGEQGLADACQAAGADPAAVLAALDDAPAVAGGLEGLTPGELADRIVDTHHRYLWEELPALDALADKVLGVHGERHPELAEVRRLVAELRADLEPHLAKEERILFPAIHALESGPQAFPFGAIDNPIATMGVEHEQAGELLTSLREVTSGYETPADGCASYRSLYERLAELENDTHLHIHAENHLLFPAAIALSAGH
jgi:regulator of cell morphogenesis and NO signaling